MALSLPTRMAGAELPDLVVTWQDEDGNDRALVGALTGYMTNVITGTTRAITGTLTADADQVTNKGEFTWVFSTADVATAGEWRVYFVDTTGGKSYKSLDVKWVIKDAPTSS